MSTITEQAVEFTPFPKIARLNRTVVITEKIDGTNAAVGVTETGQVYAQSSKRLITPESDNFGFARWVQEHADELRDGLGEGLHFGEWWGLGIQRGYGLNHKRFSLFNVARWNEENPPPACCRTVPQLDIWGKFDSARIKIFLDDLRLYGSYAAPDFMDPEGIVVYHTAGRQLFKVTLDNDAQPKGSAREAAEAPAPAQRLPDTPEDAAREAYRTYREHSRPFRRVFRGIITRKQRAAIQSIQGESA